MRIFVTSAYPDLEPLTSFLKLASYGQRHELADSAQSADVILFVENSRYHDDPFFSRLKRHPIVHAHRERVFMYNEHDRPWLLLPGLYCSMPTRWFNKRRQLATRYVRLLNPVDVPASGREDTLFSFMGRAESALRKQIVSLAHPRAIIEDTSKFDAFSSKGSTANHEKYADVLRRSKFVICPRGVGTSSIRLFECLRAGRVPIIVADQWVEPEGPDWSSCSVRVAERDVASIPKLAEELESLWPQMSRAARDVWARFFDDAVFFDQVGDGLASLLARRGRSEKIAQRIPTIPAGYWRARMTLHLIASRKLGVLLR